MKENTLLVFVISPNIGAYINAMTHAVVYRGINRIVLVHIDKAPIGKPLIEFRDFKAKLEKVITEDLPKNIFEGKPFITPKDFTGYNELKKVFTTNLVIKDVNYNWLKSYLKNLIKDFGDCIVDLTGVVKRVSFEIFIACSYLGMDEIATFELKNNKRGIDALYHNLKQNDDFEYVILHNSGEFVDSLDAISNKKNKIKLQIAVVSILLILFMTFVEFFFKNSVRDYWIYLLATNVFAVFGGILPIFDAWGGLKFRRKK